MSDDPLGCANLKSSFASAWSLEIWPTWIMDLCWPPWQHFIWPIFFTCCWLLPALVAFSIISGYPGAPRGKGRAAQCPCKCWWPQKDEVITLKCDPLWYYEAWKAPPRMKATSRNQINAGLHHMSWCDMLWLASKSGYSIHSTNAFPAGSHWCQKWAWTSSFSHSCNHPGLNFYRDSKSG